MAVELSSHLSKSPDHANDGSFESATSSGVIINAYTTRHKDTATPNYFTFNSLMEQSPAIQESPIVSGILHRHSSNHIVLNDNSKNGYFATNTANQVPPFQRVGVNGSSNFISSHSPQRNELDLSPRQQDGILMSHTTMFDPASTASNAYNHSFGILAGNGLHATTNLMNTSVDLKPSSLQSLQPHSFYTHAELAASHDQNAAQRTSLSPLFGNPMGYRAYPQIGDLFQPRAAEFYTQQTSFGHPQYW